MSMRGDDDTPNDKPSEGQWVTGEKNPAAVALGRLGGRKGGPARAEKLSALRRSEIARLAAQKRWHSERDEQKEG